MRHLASGRKIHAYDVPKGGKLLYIIDLDRIFSPNSQSGTSSFRIFSG
jgi:hypothetical protein